MTQPRRSDYDDYADDELQHWPGVQAARRMRSKHASLVLTYNGASRTIVYPVSGSDRRGPLNHLQDIRRTLRDLGAERRAPGRSKAPRRARNRTEPREIAIPLRDKTRLDANPFEALAGFQCAPPPEPAKPEPTKPTLWGRIVQLMKGTRP